MLNNSITLIGDAAHLMTPFAGVGVNLAMQDALELSQHIISSQDSSGWSSQAALKDSIAKALRDYEVRMWKRAEGNAKATWMYLELFFNPRGAHAMIAHFEQEKANEARRKLGDEQ